jgi:hypothetical protein
MEPAGLGHPVEFSPHPPLLSRISRIGERGAEKVMEFRFFTARG